MYSIWKEGTNKNAIKHKLDKKVMKTPKLVRSLVRSVVSAYTSWYYKNINRQKWAVFMKLITYPTQAIAISSLAFSFGF